MKLAPRPLERRPFKTKKTKLHFHCPLCRTERDLRYVSKLNRFQYVQISTIALSLFALTFPLMHGKAFIWFFIVWASYECVNKLLYRRDIPCPHCGFDATWYKRDVRVAKRLVHEFWEERKKEEVSDTPVPPQDTPAEY